MMNPWYEQVFLALIIAVAAYGAYTTIVNDWACGRLVRFRAHYEKVLAFRGLAYTEALGGYDDSPCQTQWVLTGPEISITLYSRRMLKLINGIKHGRIDDRMLRMMSDTPCSKVPT